LLGHQNNELGERVELRACDQCQSALSKRIEEEQASPSSPRLFRSEQPAALDMAAFVQQVRDAVRLCRESLASEGSHLSSADYARAVSLQHEFETRIENALLAAESAYARWRVGELTEREFAAYLDEPERIMLELAYAVMRPPPPIGNG
jgi:hypothetical protein